MGCTCETWVKGVNYLQDFKWFICNFYMCINHGIFVGTMFICCSLRTCIPCGWYDTLIVCRASIFNVNPVAQTTTRCIYKSNAFSIFIPCIWLKLSCISHCSITILMFATSLLKKYWLIFVATCASRPRQAVRPTIVVIHT